MDRRTGIRSVLAGLTLVACGHSEVAQRRGLPTPELLARHCRDMVGAPRVERVGEGVVVARGYNLANITLIQTAEGDVIVGAGMTPARAAAARGARLTWSPGPIRALIFTHSHAAIGRGNAGPCGDLGTGVSGPGSPSGAFAAAGATPGGPATIGP